MDIFFPHSTGWAVAQHFYSFVLVVRMLLDDAFKLILNMQYLIMTIERKEFINSLV